MIQIEKFYGAIPDSIDNEIIENKIKKIVSGEIEFSWETIEDYDKVKNRLVSTYKEKCAFCEQKVAPKELNIIHFRPYNGCDTCSAYKSLAYEWSNLLLVCNRCKKLKSDKFKLDNNLNENKLYKRKILKKGKERLPYNEPLKNEIPKLINPEIDAPETCFEFQVNGVLIPRNARGDYTIEELKLNEEALYSKRKKHIDDFFNLIKDETLKFFERTITEITYIKNIETNFQKLFKQKENFYAFSAYTNYVLNHFEEFTLFKIEDSEICSEINKAFKSYKAGRQIQLQEFNNFICNDIRNSINNSIKIDGDGNISLQNINDSVVTVNYNDKEKIIEIINEFRDSHKVEYKLLAEHLEIFNSKIETYRDSEKNISTIIEGLTKEADNYNSKINNLLSQINNTLHETLEFLRKELKEIQEHLYKQDKSLANISNQITNSEKDLLSNLSEALKTEFESIKSEINAQSKDNGMAIAQELMASIAKVEDKMTHQQLEIFERLNQSSDNWQAKVKFSIPILKQLGVDVEWEYQLNDIVKGIGTRLKSWLEKLPASSHQLQSKRGFR